MIIDPDQFLRNQGWCDQCIETSYASALEKYLHIMETPDRIEAIAFIRKTVEKYGKS